MDEIQYLESCSVLSVRKLSMKRDNRLNNVLAMLPYFLETDSSNNPSRKRHS